MAGGSLAERRDAHQRGAAHEKPVQSSSAERLITAPHVQVIHTHSPSTAESRSPQALVVLDEGVEIVEQAHHWEP
jgi:3-oxoacyl-(acyl-carrier-protein) synthase